MPRRKVVDAQLPKTRQTTPYEDASRRLADAAGAYHYVRELTKRLHAETEAEFDAARAEQQLYMKPDGTPLPEDEQRAIQAQRKLPMPKSGWVKR